MNQDHIVLEIKLPVPVRELAALVPALEGIHGKGTLKMRQVGEHMQIFKPARVDLPFIHQLTTDI